jgi:hypothetical protein
MENEIGTHKGKVFKVTDKTVIMDVTYEDGYYKETREFPKTLFNKIEVDEEYLIKISGGSGWMQVDFEKINKDEPKYVAMIDDDDTVSEDQIQKLLHHFSHVDFVNKCKEFAIDCHKKVNQTYDGKPYSFHLKMAVNFGYMFLDLAHIPIMHRHYVIGGLWNHDMIEDTGITLNDLIKATSKQVGEIAYALTNEKGRNRSERANAKYYRGIRKTEYATFGKLCDRMANVQHSINAKHSYKGEGMFAKYKKEHPNFIWKLIKPEWYEIHQHVLHLFMGSKLFGRYRKEKSRYNVMIMHLENMFNIN